MSGTQNEGRQMAAAAIASLLKKGLFRQAAHAIMRQDRSRESFNNPDSQLAFALAKAGRFRAALSIGLESITRHPDQDNRNVLNAVEQALRAYQPSIDEIRLACSRIKRLTITLEQIAKIASCISNKENRDFLLNHLKSVLSITGQELELCDAYLLNYLQDSSGALSIAQRLFCNNPELLDAGYLCACILRNNNRTYHARRYATALLKKDRCNLRVLDLLGQLLHAEARWRAARKVYELINNLTHDDFSLANRHLALPIIALSADDLFLSHKGFNWLEFLLSEKHEYLGIEMSNIACSAITYSFSLPYQGPCSIIKDLENAAQYLRNSAQELIYENCSHMALSKNSPQRQASFGSSEIQTTDATTKKIRIGFISRFFCHHTNSAAHIGLISELDREKFTIVIIHRPFSKIDSYHDLINSLANEVLYLSDHFGESCRQIQSLYLDILFYTDLGMYPLDCILAMVRLAPTQVTSWGLPHSTGIKEIDYYLRSHIFSGCESQSEYSEKLISLNGYIGFFKTEEECMTTHPRDYFLLPPDRFLVGCLQSLHKIHPDFDQYLEEIAQIDPSIMIVMTPSHNDMLSHRFVRRLRISAPTACNQMCFVKTMSISEFYSLNNCFDLNLDTIYYGAGISFIQTAWIGTPYITHSSGTVRSSVVSCSYDFCGIESPPVANSPREYVDLVRYYYNDRQALAAMKEQLKTKSIRLYNDKEYVRAYEKFFLQIANSEVPSACQGSSA
jgi:hypothetical protein